MKNLSANTKIIHIFIVIGILFITIAAYLTFFELFGKESIMANSYNKRLYADDNEIIRGEIYDRSGEKLAYTVKESDTMKRIYPFNELYAHVIGYNSRTYGKTLLEAKYNDILLGNDSLGYINKAENLIKGNEKTGDSITLTIDHKLQKLSKELLGSKKGSIVAIDPKTGEILSMISTPDFDPNEDKLSKDWESISKDELSPLLPRATIGLYPPGSTFKVVTAVSAITNDLGDTTFEDEGTIVIDGKTFSNYNEKSYGEENMKDALTVSSNVYFSQLAQLIGADNLISTSEKSGINKKFDFDLSLAKSTIGTKDMGKTELAATGIGQGKLMVTPLQMAMIASGIANDGVIMKPYLVEEVNSQKGTSLKKTSPQKLYDFTDKATADIVTDMMTEVVNSGTGKAAKLENISVAGKTGTAQNEKSILGSGYDHAWFIGFAPADDPKIAVAIILEYQDKGGGKAAAPIAHELFKDWLDR